MRKIVFTSLFLFGYCVYGQLSTREKPVSYSIEVPVMTINNNTYKTMPSLDMGLIIQEDEESEANGMPPRFGYKHKVDFNLDNSGEWTTLYNGDKIWRLSIYCPGALSINLLYDKFWIPDGAKFFI